MCSEHVHYGHPNVIILEVVYAFTLQDIVIGASQYVLSAVTSDTRKEKDTSNLYSADCSIRGYLWTLKIEMFAVWICGCLPDV